LLTNPANRQNYIG